MRRSITFWQVGMSSVSIRRLRSQFAVSQAAFLVSLQKTSRRHFAKRPNCLTLWPPAIMPFTLPMNKQHYFFKLIPPRPTFPHDMTDKEKVLMDEHSAYFKQQFEAGKLLLYGPVMAPTGAFGLAILEVADESEAQRFGDSDPSVRGGLNRWEVYPIHVAMWRAKI